MNLSSHAFPAWQSRTGKASRHSGDGNNFCLRKMERSRIATLIDERLQAAEATDFALLRRIPTTSKFDFIDHYYSLDPIGKSALRRSIGYRAAAAFGYPIDRVKDAPLLVCPIGVLAPNGGECLGPDGFYDKLWVEMTLTTIRAAIHHRVRRIFSSRSNFERRLRQWIFLYWTMLSLVDAVPTRSVGGTIAFERPVYFDAFLTLFHVPTLCSHEHFNRQGIQGW